MAKDRRSQRKTDAGRIPDAGTGKLDQDTEETPRAGAREPGRRGRADRPADVDEVRERLAAERREALSQLERLGTSPELTEADERGEAGSIVEEGDAAQASQRRDLAFITRERLANRINRLTAALRRIQEGKYGHCDVCGGEIELQRLAALPEATTCLRCQEARERGEAAA